MAAEAFSGSPPAVRFIGTTDSTNNYASAMYAAGEATHGSAFVAAVQTAGRGQRGRMWMGTEGDSLLMSMIVRPQCGADQLPLFNMAVALGTLQALQAVSPLPLALSVKWPNDVMICDRKAGGILIENAFRGSTWDCAVVGIGLNLRQRDFPSHLPFATSLRQHGLEVSPRQLAEPVRDAVLSSCSRLASAPSAIMGEYNRALFRRGQEVVFEEAGVRWPGRVDGVDETGCLRLLTPGGERTVRHGELTWLL